MRKQNLLLLLLLTATYFNELQATTVSEATAQTVALNFFKGSYPAVQASAANLCYTRTESDGIVDYYVFNMSPAKGFVIVTADDIMTPVIAYSSESYFHADLNSKTGVSNWMVGAGRTIHRVILNGGMSSATVSAIWAACLRGPYAPSTRSGTVGPLVTTTWDQQNSYTNPPPYQYNFFCPWNSADQLRCVTGCVATAMGQIMKYWNYPTTGTGSFSYNDATSLGYQYNYGTLSANFGTTTYKWTQMPVALTNSTTASQDSAVSLLIYHAGVSVAMDYGDGTQTQGGSGSYMTQYDAGGAPGSPSAQHSYPTYFKYNPNTIKGYQYYNRYTSTYNFTSTQWLDSIKKDLNAGRPIQYAGSDTGVAGGHSWVCDGYDVSNKLHMNWGWGGFDNGFFAITALEPLNTGTPNWDFIDNQEILTGIQPLVSLSVTASAAVNPICPTHSTTLSVSRNPAGATYTWSPSTGLSSTTAASPTATPTSTTTYTVTVDSAGVTATASVTLTVAAVPATPSNVVLPTACSGLSAIYTVPAVSGATSYIWTVSGAGWSGAATTSSDSISLTAGTVTGTVTVKASNTCGTSSAYSFSAPLSTAPGVISGIIIPSPICSGQPENFIAHASTGASTYHWAVTGSGWTGTSNTSSLTLTPGTTTATLAVNGVNACGSGTAFTTTVTSLASPVASYSVSNHSVLQATNVAVTFTGSAAGGTTYAWSFDGGTASPGTGAGPQTVTWTTTGTKTVTLTLDNGGCTSTYTDTIQVYKPNGISTVSNTVISTMNIVPNPAAGQANISIGLTEETSVSILVYDITGQLVATLYNGALSAGDHNIAFNTDSIVSGVYLVKVTDGKSSLMKRFVKL